MAKDTVVPTSNGPEAPPGRHLHGAGDPPDAVVFEYSGLEGVVPVYVEGAFGDITPQGLLNVLLFTDYRKPETTEQKLEVIENTSSGVVMLKPADDPSPFRIDEENRVRFIRHVQANFLITKDRLDALITWLEGKRREMAP